MSVATVELPARELWRRVDRAIKDKSYRSTPLGLEVARYIRWKRNEWGATPATIRDYEAILARLALFHSDLEFADLEVPHGTDLLSECLEAFWADAAGRTKAKVISVWRDFFEWGIDKNRGIVGNAAKRLRTPKKRGVKREPFDAGFVTRVIGAQEHVADKLGCTLILFYALRRTELAGVRFKDFDFERRILTVVGKGGKVRITPVVDEPFWRDLAAVELEFGGHEGCREWFLIHHREKRGMKLFRYPHKGYVPRSMHTWWYDRLDEAGIDDRTGLGMHRGRHTAATNVLRATGNLAAAQALLGHADIKTTIESYAEFNTGDLARALQVTRAAEGD